MRISMPDMRVTKTFCQCTSMGALRPKPQKIIFSSFSFGKTTCTGNHIIGVERDVENLRSGGGEHVIV